MAAIEFQVSIPIIEWIAKTVNSSIEELAEEIAPKKQDLFLSGKINKTQADKLTKLVNIPFGFLFLKEPPKVEVPTLPDFRSTVDKVPLSNDFHETLEDILNKVDWYKDYLIDCENTDKLTFVGKFDYSLVSPVEVANDIANHIDFSILRDIKKIKKEDYLKILVTKFEKIGILIFQSGIVKSNTKKSLSVREFRGFAIVDDIAPVIFLNSKDAKSAQLFSLIHEVSHIWIGKSGVSDWSNDQEIETFCNKVAANFLMPRDSYQAKWQSQKPIVDNIIEIADFFKVSYIACTIRANELGIITQATASSLKSKFEEQLALILANKPKSSGGNPYATIPLRNSKTLTDAVLTQAINQNIMLSDASKLLNIRPNTVMNLYKKQLEIRLKSL